MQTPKANDAAARVPGLLHRWFVQYNPIYLLSAMLVLGGVILSSRGLAHEGSLYGPLAVAAITEVYAGALIFGAALLMRIGQQRSAVLLAMITIVYQCDLTLHTETCAYLGGVGVAASLAWLSLFVAKLYALGWAVRIALSPRAVATATLGALGLTLFPYLLPGLDAADAGKMIAVFVFALASLYPSRAAENTANSRVSLEDWGHTVLRRSVRVTWSLWAVLLALHILFWASQRSINLLFVAPSGLFLALRRAQKESRVWAISIATLVVVFAVAPSAVSLCALFAAFTLVQRAFSEVRTIASVAAEPTEGTPYRAPDDTGFVPRDSSTRFVVTFTQVSLAARTRLLTGALLAFYLSAWTYGYSGATFPAHVLALDALFAAGALVLAWRMRSRVALLPLALVGGQDLLAHDLVPRPHSLLEWGGAAVALGFVLLLGSLAASYRLRHVKGPSTDVDGGERAQL